MLLQITQDTTAAVTGAAAATGKSLSLFELLTKGGWLMIPIGLLFIYSIYLFIERLINIRRASKVSAGFMDRIQQMVESGNIAGARELCRQTDTPPARMLEKALKKLGAPIHEIEKTLENAGRLEVAKLEKNLSILGTIAGIAPMFGFVGTIIGVIIIFFRISETKEFGIDTIAAGLYQKMITSAAGLIVGIIAHAGYHYLVLQVDREINKMETMAAEFLELLQEPTQV